MGELLLSLTIGIILVLVVSMVYYEILRSVWAYLPRCGVVPRQRILVVILAIFIGHCFAVFIYALCFWLLVTKFHMGVIDGQLAGTFEDFLYFSVSIYSSLGIGDIFPTGGLRLIAGMEVLNGLVLIGWSVSFTYLAMEKFWDKKNPKK